MLRRAAAAAFILLLLAACTGAITKQQALDAVFSSNLLVGIYDLDQYPREPGKKAASITAGGPEARKLPATFETAVVRTDSGYRVTLTMRWTEGPAQAQSSSVAIYDVSQDGSRVLEVSRAGHNVPQYRK
jgi:hypothetical protein